jgi:hypothetical protein
MDEMKPKITGYRTLSEAEIALINRVKAKAVEVSELLMEIQKLGFAPIATADHQRPQPELPIDHRWVEIGRTDLQKGFMSLIRAIARPEGF